MSDIFKKGVLAAVAVVLASLYFFLSPVKWYAYNEDNEYINLKAHNRTSVIVACPWKSREVVQAVYNISAISEHLKGANVDLIWLVPLSENSSIETAQLLKRRYNLNVELCFATPKLWSHLFKGNDENDRALTIFIKQGKERGRLTGVHAWLSDQGLKQINDALDTNILLF